MGREGGGGVQEKPIYRGNCLKRGGLGQFADLSGKPGKKEGVVDTPVHFMVFTSELSCWLVESLKGLPSLAHTTNQF